MIYNDYHLASQNSEIIVHYGSIHRTSYRGQNYDTNTIIIVRLATLIELTFPSRGHRHTDWESERENHSYSQVHKYWDIDTILTFLALYTTTMDFKWNEQDVL